MSWSNEHSKIVKNAHLLKKFELSAFGSDEALDVSKKPEGPEDEDSFEELGPSGGGGGNLLAWKTNRKCLRKYLL